MYSCQAFRTALGLSISGSSPASDATISMAVVNTRCVSPDISSPYHARPTSLDSTSGSPASSCGISPYISAWSEITRKSSGFDSLARSPCVVVTSSPRAKRKASSWLSRFIVPASTDTIVCRCVSPHSTRTGKLRPA